MCGLPNNQITLDRFIYEYEKKYGHKMSYYGHSKLSGLLESFTSTLVVSNIYTEYCIDVNLFTFFSCFIF